MTDSQHAISLLKLKDVQSRTGLSSSSIYERLNPLSKRYDACFPRQISIGGSSERPSVRWVSTEVDQWINQRISQSRGSLSKNFLTLSDTRRNVGAPK